MKILSIPILAFALTSCFNSIPNYLPDNTRVEPWDEFKETDRYTLNFNISPEEKQPALLGMRSTFLREITSGEKDRFFHYVILNKGYMAFYPEAEFFVKTDEKIFKLKAEVKEVEHFHKTTESTSIIQQVDSSLVTVIDSNNSTNYIQQRFVYEISEVQRLAILKSKDVSFRFYSGGLPSTFEIKPRDLYDLKVLLDTL